MGNSSLDRRQFLLGVVPAATLGTLGVAACSNKTPTSTSYAPTYFNIAEWAFINAAVGRLIPSDGAGPGGVDAGVPEFIDRQMELPYGHALTCSAFGYAGQLHRSSIGSRRYAHQAEIISGDLAQSRRLRLSAFATSSSLSGR
jgi:hypothetical protein